ncbi:hypothetical protein R84B8_01727 [Treponema sp. R8-4-B8]
MAGKNFASRTLLIIFIAFLFLSCDGLFIINDNLSGNFWANNKTTGKDYNVKAELLFEGVHCKVWAETGGGVSKTQAKYIADKYDKKIYGLMISAFSIENPEYDNRKISDIMALADYIGDSDGKLCILLLDIKDDYQPGKNESYIAGYFWNGNFYSSAKVPGSNQRDMIYIDTNPGMRNIENIFTTLAHEMQHMMNFVTRVERNSDELMDTWIDEGLSSAAEYIVSGQHSLDRIDWYNKNGDSSINVKGLIDQGNNFFVWGNHTTDRNPYPILDDYATVYLFFQWLRIQKGISVYRNIISSNYCDYRAVAEAMGEDWDTLLKNWMAANYINNSTGTYGYKGDISIIAHTAPAGKTQVVLYPGEGVYSLTDAGDAIPPQGANIRYAGLDKAAVTVSDSAVFAAGALLTYNINTELAGLGSAAETGTTTGKAARVNITPMGRSAAPSYGGPYRIGAGDIHPQNGQKRDFTSWNFQDK